MILSNSLISRSLAIFLIVSIGLNIFIPSALGVAGSGEYDLQVNEAVNAPTQQITIDGTEYTVSALAARNAGEPLEVRATVPDGEEFVVDLYTSDKKVETFRSGSGTEWVSFDTSNLEPGTYFLTLQVDGSYEEIYPVTITGYDISINHPTTVEEDESANVTVTVNQTVATNPPAGVEVAIWDSDETRRIKADRVDDETYRATVSGLTTGTYDLYAVAQGEDTIDGEHEILGMSSGQHLEVEKSSSSGSEPSSPSEPDSPAEPSSPSEPDSPSDSDSPPQTGEPTENESENSSKSSNTTEEEENRSSKTENGTEMETGSEQDSEKNKDSEKEPQQSSENSSTNGTETENNTETTNSSTKETGADGTVISPSAESTNETTESTPADRLPSVTIPLIAFVLVSYGVGIRLLRR